MSEIIWFVYLFHACFPLERKSFMYWPTHSCSSNSQKHTWKRPATQYQFVEQTTDIAVIDAVGYLHSKNASLLLYKNLITLPNSFLPRFCFIWLCALCSDEEFKRFNFFTFLLSCGISPWQPTHISLCHTCASWVWLNKHRMVVVLASLLTEYLCVSIILTSPVLQFPARQSSPASL